MLEKLPDALGAALADVRAGIAQTLYHGVDLRQGMAAIRLGSLAFADHAPIPARYTADGPGLSPPLHWSGVPEGAAEVVLIVEDADSPTPQPMVHAIAHRLPVDAGGSGALAEGAMSDAGDAEPAAAMGRNSMLQTRWLPPDPPPGHGVHRYLFQVYALEGGDALPDAPGRDALRQALLDRGVASGCLIGTYERQGSVREPAAKGLEDAVVAPSLGGAQAA